ncbi:MAG: HNH endonuclease [Candidatus Dadabacteria bacterium]
MKTKDIKTILTDIKIIVAVIIFVLLLIIKLYLGLSEITLGPRTRTFECRVFGALQDRACTPGAIIKGVTREQICTPGYSKEVRDVSDKEKEEVFREYGIKHHRPGQYEVDHLVSLELGGSNGIANLWPESAEPRPGYHEKDRLEDYLHRQVCNGNISLEEAQRLIANDWLSVYEKIPKTARRKE